VTARAALAPASSARRQRGAAGREGVEREGAGREGEGTVFIVVRR